MIANSFFHVMCYSSNDGFESISYYCSLHFDSGYSTDVLCSRHRELLAASWLWKLPEIHQPCTVHSEWAIDHLNGNFQPGNFCNCSWQLELTALIPDTTSQLKEGDFKSNFRTGFRRFKIGRWPIEDRSGCFQPITWLKTAQDFTRESDWQEILHLRYFSHIQNSDNTQQHKSHNPI